jgi:hypothetical protein
VPVVRKPREREEQITRRNRGVSFAQVFVELNLFLVGWLTYYRLAAFRWELIRMDEGYGGNCAAIVSNNAKGVRQSLISGSDSVHHRPSRIA